MSSKEAKPSEALLGASDFFEMSLDNLVVAGLDGFFRNVNPSWTRTLGWTVQELMSRPSVEFVHPDDRALTLEGRARLQGGAPMGPLINRYLHKDGTVRWFEWRSVSHVERGLVYAAARDITDQKLAEQKLAEAERAQRKLQRQLIFSDRMASVGTLAGGVAHEINNPLSSIAANIALLLEQLPGAGEETELRQLAADVQRGAERIRKIVAGLTTFSRHDVARPAVIALEPVLELAVDMTLNEIRPRAQLVTDFGPTPKVEVDDGRLGQVLINLIVNACQALPEGHSESNEIRLATSTDAAGRAVIEVSDTGPGIPAEILERIFDPFFTTKPVGIGTGLGLFVCHNLVAGMGGELSVVSRAGATTFRVVLPAAS